MPDQEEYNRLCKVDRIRNGGGGEKEEETRAWRETQGRERARRKRNRECNSREQWVKIAREELDYKALSLCLLEFGTSLTVDSDFARGGDRGRENPPHPWRSSFELGDFLRNSVGRMCPTGLQGRFEC